MNLFRTPLRRTTAVVAGAFLGLAGAVALVSPASAHSPVVDGHGTCADDKGNWTIDWKIGNDYYTDAVVARQGDGVSTSEKLAVTGDIKATDKIIPANSDEDESKQVSGQTLAGPDNDSVTLNVFLYWPKDHFANYEPKTKTVYRPHDCKPTPPTTSPTTPPTPPTTPPTKPPTPPTTPPTSPTSAPPTTKPPAPGEPTPILTMDCTTLTIGLDNPANGVDITLHFKTSKGEQRTTLISKGQKKTEKFSATPGFTITVSADGIDNGGSETIAYKKPAGCSGNGSGGGLPVTGAAAGTIAGGAALLLIVGGVLFVMARRRKVKFTA